MTAAAQLVVGPDEHGVVRVGRAVLAGSAPTRPVGP